LHQEELNTWNKLFRIKERYLAKCCAPGGGQYWLKLVNEECKNYKKTVQDILNAQIMVAENNP
jgi:hypothetical protein